MKILLILTFVYLISGKENIEHEKLESPAEVPEVPTTKSVFDQYLDINKGCMEKLNLSRDIFEDIKYKISSAYLSVPISPEYTNYLSCYWKSKNLQLDNGQINFPELEKLVYYAVKITIDASDVPLLNTWLIATEIMDKCKDSQGKTHGEKAANMRNCIFGRLLEQRNALTEPDTFEDIPNLDLTEENCVNELNLNGLEIEDINRHYMVPENVTNFNEFLACYWKKIDIMDKDGHFNNSALLLRLDKVIKSEVLARSRAIYLSDILTESILNGCRGIKGSNDGELILKVQNYILKRLPYFKLLI